MIEAAKIIGMIANTSGYTEKQYLLKKNEHVQGLKEILRFIYNPYNKTGLAATKVGKALAAAKPYVVGDASFIDYKQAIAYFKSHTTGSDHDAAFAARFINCTRVMFCIEPWAEIIAKAIVTQDLQIGVTAKTLNAVYGPSFIPTVGCMLGTKITDVPEHKRKWPCIVTEKLDGRRCILIKEDGICRLYSRSGHEESGFDEIIAEAAHLPDNRVYDGEFLAIGSFKDSVALRQATNSIASTKGKKTGLSFNIFDMLAIEDFYNKSSVENAYERKLLLAAMFGDEAGALLRFEHWHKLSIALRLDYDFKFIKVVPILGYAKNMDEVTPIVSEIWKTGGEGVMLNYFKGLYEVKRSKDLLKVKHTEEHTLKVVDMLEGTGKYEDMLGALVVEYKVPKIKVGVNATNTPTDSVEYDVYKIGVGSGFTDAQRMQYWTNPSLVIGKFIEIDSFGESVNLQGTKSLNCPIFKRIVGEV